jgi:nicotinamide-nucleotide amidase
MKAEIISIGDEILIGQINNTNSVWIAQQLNLIGVTVTYMTTVADHGAAIFDALNTAKRSDIVFITGGLGPTKDDITKKILSQFLNVPLELDQKTLVEVTNYFSVRGKVITEINKLQAMIPKGSVVIPNKNGTAPGIWMKKENTIYISMPGVPYEMKGMMIETILPKIKNENVLPFIYHKTILTQGIGESSIAEMIEKWEDSLVEKNIKLAYLPQPGIVRLRLSSIGKNKEETIANVENESKIPEKILSKYIFGFEKYGEEQPGLEKIVSELLRKKKETVSLAESCTGGYIASLITGIAGASEIFKGGIVPYSNEAKHGLLQVDKDVFVTKGAVSKDCVEQLAKNVLQKFQSDHSIAVSGIAGPSGGTAEKPVGLVWIAIANKTKVVAKEFRFGDDRQRNIVMTANAALNMLRQLLE